MPDFQKYFETPQKARTAIICLAAALATFGAIAVYIGYSFGSSSPGADDPPSQTEPASDAPSESVIPDATEAPTQTVVGIVPALTIDQARELALADAGTAEGETKVTREALAQDNGVWVYEFRFRTEEAQYEYKLNANTGEVRSMVKEAFVSASPEPTEPVMPSIPAESVPSAQPSAEPQPTRSTAPDPTQPPASDPPAATPTPAPSQSGTMYIGMDQAKTIALNHAGLTASQVRFTHTRMGRENGVIVYKIEFRQGSVEYEYKINAATGRILDYERDAD